MRLVLFITISPSFTSHGAEALGKSTHAPLIVEAMYDNFNTPRAIATLFELTKETNRAANLGMNIAEARHTLLKLADILGLTLKEKTHITPDAEAFSRLSVSTREDLRQHQHWQVADRIRRGLADLGVILEDTSQKTIWKYKR
ncbi:MAG: DALR domain-containing protein [Dehalococcoidia bacterium]